MGLLDADTAQSGLTIVAAEQTQGKGQRGRRWADVPGQSLLMSIITQPAYPLEQQFAFNSAVAVAVAEVLQGLHEHWNVAIKWPNDIIINDKKAGGVLIENVIRGNSWTYSIIGIGLNILQDDFPLDLPIATSLKIASGKSFQIEKLMHALRTGILTKLYGHLSPKELLEQYNSWLYKRGEQQLFADEQSEWKGLIVEVTGEGQLAVQHNERIGKYTHGSILWKWE